MAKLPRIFQKIFASSAPSSDIAVFGSLAAGSPSAGTNLDTLQSLSKFLAGWRSAIIGNNSPILEDMNALHFLLTSQMAYQFQAGVPEWDPSTIYYTGSFVNASGVLYISLTDANTNNAVTDITKWAPYGVAQYLAKVFGDSPYTTRIGQTVNFNATAGSSVVNLPTAVGLTGQKITVRKSDSSFNSVTVTPFGAQTIDGAVSFVLWTEKESVTVESDGANWVVIDHVAPSIYHEYTPDSSTGLGTISAILMRWQRVGGQMRIWGILNSGIVTGATAAVAIPNSANWTLPFFGGSDISVFGTAAANGVSGGRHVIAINGSSELKFGVMSSTTPSTPISGGTLIGNNNILSINALIPIDQWNH